MILSMQSFSNIMALQFSQEPILASGEIVYAGGLPWLHTEGRYIKDQYGREVVLHGVNLDIRDIDNVTIFRWRFGGNTVNETITLTKQVGAKIIRLAADGGLWERPDYKELVDTVVALSADAGMYVAIDFHQIIDEWTPQLKAEMIMNDTSQQRALWLDFWISVATRFKNQSAVLYSILNEPQKAKYKLDEAAPAWYDLALNLSREIHAVNPKALILVSTLCDSSKKIQYFDQNPLPESNIVYVWHDYYANDLYFPYRKYQYALNYADGNLSTARVELEQFLQDAALFMLDLDLPVIMEEFGATPTFLNQSTREKYPVPNWDIEIQDRYNFYASYNLTWIQWIWKREIQTSQGFGVLEDDGRSLNSQGILLAANI